MNTIFEYLENYLPDYHDSDDVARLLDLDLYLRGEMEETSGMFDELRQRLNADLFAEYAELQDKLFAEAFQEYLFKNNKLC